MTNLSDLTGTWQIDPAHSTIGFSAKHAMVTTVHGTFGGAEGTINVTSPTSADVNVTIDTTTVDTGQEMRDNHLRSADFLDVENNPTITFVSTGISDIDDNEFTLEGDLTIRGTTRPVSLKAEFAGTQVDHRGSKRAGFEATTTISRKDFGLTWNAALEAGGVLVSDKIKINLDVSAIQQA